MFGLFGNNGGSQAAAPAAPAAQPAAPTGGEGQQPTQGQQGQPTQQASQSAPVKPQGLDYLTSLFDNGGGESNGNQAPRLQINGEQIGKVASGHDYSSLVTPEHLAKLQSGDMSALGEMFNNLGRQVYQQAMQDATYLTDGYVDKRFSHADSQFEQRVARTTSTQNVQGVNDLHPMAKNMLLSTVAQLRQANPQAPQAELEAEAWELLHSLGTQFDRKGRQQQQQQKAAETDWDEVLGPAG